MASAICSMINSAVDLSSTSPMPISVFIIINRHVAGVLRGQSDLCLRLLRFVAVAEDFCRRRDDPNRNHEWEQRSVDRRMNEEKPAGCCADDKRKKDTAHAAALVAGYSLSSGDCAEQEDIGSGCGGRKYAGDLKVSNSTALHSHCQRPRGQESGNDVGTGPGAGRKPYQHEAEMGQ